MTVSTQVFISTPCHEDWGNMQPNQEGRFCGSCQKTVVDFTMMSDQEVLAWFSKASGSVCGRMSSDQMHRNLVPATPPKKGRWTIWWQFLVAGLLVSSKASAQGKVSVTPIEQTIPGSNPLPIQAPSPDTTHPIRTLQNEPLQGWLGGISVRQVPTRTSTIRVVDSTSGSPVEAATVRIGTRTFVTDAAGSVSVRKEYLAKADKIEVTYAGYQKKNIDINSKIQKGNIFTIELGRSTAMLGDVVVAGYVNTRRISCGGVFVKGLGTIKDTLTSWLVKGPVTVYPNPVTSGASVTVSLDKVKSGDYIIQLFSNAGALVETMRLEGVDGPRTELLQLPGSLAAGMYFIKISNTSTGEIYTQKLSIL